MLNRKAPEPVAGYPEDALSDILARENLVITATRTEGTAKVSDFMTNEARRIAFWTILDRDYEGALGIPELEKRDTNTISGEPFNSSFSPAATRPLTERHRFTPKITIADIASGVETIEKITFRQPEYTTTIDKEQTTDIAEGGDIPTTIVSYSDVPGKTKKFGGGVRWSDEFALEDTNMSLIRMLARRQAMRDEIKIVREGLTAALRAAGGTHDIDLGASVGFEQIVGMALFDGPQTAGQNPNEDNGYQVMTIFGIRDVVKRLVLAYGSVDNPGVFSQYPQDQFGELFNPIQLINSGLGGPTRVGLVRDNAVVVTPGTLLLDATTALGIDTRYALVLQRVARGMTSEEMRIAKQQVTERYSTQRIGWLISDPDACFNIGV